LIDQLIEEHKRILNDAQEAEKIANDAGALLELRQTKDDFLPARFGDIKRGLQSLEESLGRINHGLQGHFEREEGQLLSIMEQRGGAMLTSGLRLLLLEHQELRDRIAQSRADIAELITVDSSREVLEGKAWGVRVYLSHTRKLLEEHARSEDTLFTKVRTELKSSERGTG
jgi:hypothetical protein